MRRNKKYLSTLPLLLVGLAVLPQLTNGQSLIDFRSPEDLASRKPILIAHRGGVVTATAPECSLAAIRIAAEDGYDMVELDVQATQDDLPVLFHDRNLTEDVGIEGRVSDFSLEELTEFSLEGSEEKIPSLREALKLCRDLNLGVMLDFKTEGTEDYYRTVHDLLDEFGLKHSTITITSRRAIREFFRNELNSPIWFRSLEGEDDNSRGRYVFDRVSAFDEEGVQDLQKKGLLAIPAINTFHYPPENNLTDAERDAQKLLDWGVDGAQIDSIYQHFFGLPERPLNPVDRSDGTIRP